MILNEYNQIVNEHFDMTDNYTRRFIASLNESGQEQLIAALSSALYDKIVAKVDDIDFGTIPQSRGDITKVQGFANTEQCIDIIRKLVIQYNQKTDIVDSIITAISNIKDRKNLFTKAFAIKADMPIMIYNLMVLAVERSVSLIIVTCIQFVKDPASSTVKTALDKVAYEKTMDDMLFKQLVTFNALCKTGTMDQTLNGAMKSKSVHEEVDVVGSILGREDDGEIGDGSEAPVVAMAPHNDIDPFGDNEAEPVPAPATEPNVEDESKYDVFDPSNKPELNPATPPVPVEKPEGEIELPADSQVTFDNNGIDPNKDYHGLSGDMVARMAKIIIPGKSEEQPRLEEVPDTTTDTVEPENIPAVSHQDDDPSVMDEPITEEEVQNEGIADIAAAVVGEVSKRTKSAIQTAGGDSNTMAALKNIIKKNKKVFAAAGIVTALFAIPFAAVKIIIPFIRNIVYYFYYTKMKVSDYLEIQAELIEANANDLENSTDSDLTEEKKAKVAERQRKWAERLRKWANSFAIDHKQATNNAKKESDKDSKEKRTVRKDEDGDDSIF